MKSKIPLKRMLLVAGITAVVFAAVIFFLVPVVRVRISYAKLILPTNIETLQNPIDGKPVASNVAAKQANLTLLTRLKIPKINIDSAIESVGLTTNGEMDAPKDPINVGWFNLGARPGDIGSAVIAGHYGVWKNGAGPAFNDLHKLREEDQLYVEDDNGETTTFVVQGSQTYDPNADASGVFTSNDGKAHLNLITCEGEWDEVSKNYSKRLIVFADKK